MPLTFPRKFAHGHDLLGADVYGELYIWPDGHFHYTTSSRNTDPAKGCLVSVSFVLFDHSGTLIGMFGMSPEEGYPIGPWGRRHDELYGLIPGDKLARAESVALVFRLAGENIGTEKLREMAGTGNELVFCPTPD